MGASRAQLAPFPGAHSPQAVVGSCARSRSLDALTFSGPPAVWRL